MRLAGRLMLLSLLIILLTTPLAAQQTGEIRGKITEDKGEILPGVSITARSPSLQGIRTAVSDKEGFFRLPLLPVGTYELNFELQGFEKMTLAGIEARLGFTATLAIILKPAVVAEEITVRAATPVIDVTRTDNSYRLKNEDLIRLPIQARNIAEVVGFTPGVTGVRTDTIFGKDSGLPSFRGEGDAGNDWLVDGLSVKGTVSNDPGIQINFDAWDEVQIISDGFAPSSGQALGGFINVVTKSGGNMFSGQLGGLLRNAGLRAEAAGAALGGQLARDGVRRPVWKPGRPDPQGQAVVFPLRQLSPNVRHDDYAIGWMVDHPGRGKAHRDEQRLRQGHLHAPEKPHHLFERDRGLLPGPGWRYWGP